MEPENDGFQVRNLLDSRGASQWQFLRVCPLKSAVFDLVVFMMPVSTGAGFCPLIDVYSVRIM